MTSKNKEECMADEVLTLAGTSALSDEEVVERVLAGDTALYEVVMRRYNTRLYRVARAILKNDGEAEDVMQDAYVKAFQHLGQFEGRAKFSTWLTRIAVHEALARAHKAKRFEDWDDIHENLQNAIGVIPLRSNPESETALVEMSRILEQAIEGLPEQYRTVVMMRDVEEMTTAETAECLSLTEDNVKIRLHRAHGMLRKELYQNARISAADAFPFDAPRCDRMVANVFARLAVLKVKGQSHPRTAYFQYPSGGRGLTLGFLYNQRHRNSAAIRAKRDHRADAQSLVDCRAIFHRNRAHITFLLT
jgi:RNA polymerase sigma-70 factor, ECF subfamily